MKKEFLIFNFNTYNLIIQVKNNKLNKIMIIIIKTFT